MSDSDPAPSTEPAGLRRLSAFTRDGEGGNPAGVLIAERLPGENEMQRIAAAVGYSETAFLEPLGDRRFRIRYFSPACEVEFCGHATIASGVALAEHFGAGTFMLMTNAGPVELETRVEHGEALTTLTAPPPRFAPIATDDLHEALGHLGWSLDECDPTIPPVLASAGAWHLVVAAAKHDRLQRLDYDFEGLRSLMTRLGLTTVQLVWRESRRVYHSRNPFPVGGVVEDPATGAAAAALAAYLRSLGAVEDDGRLTIFQGAEIGRPSRLLVDVVRGDERIRVTGAAAELR